MLEIIENIIFSFLLLVFITGMFGGIIISLFPQRIKPNHYMIYGSSYYYFCPNCHTLIGTKNHKTNKIKIYRNSCKCGQKFNWEWIRKRG